MKLISIESANGFKIKFSSYRAERGTETEHSAFEIETFAKLHPACSVWFDNTDELLFFVDAINEFIEELNIRKETDNGER